MSDKPKADNWISRYHEEQRQADQQACLRAALRHEFETEAEARAFHKGWIAKAEYNYDRASPSNDRGGNSRVMGAMFGLIGLMLVVCMGWAMIEMPTAIVMSRAAIGLIVGIILLGFAVPLWKRAARLDGERWREFNDKWGKKE